MYANYRHLITKLNVITYDHKQSFPCPIRSYTVLYGLASARNSQAVENQSLTSCRDESRSGATNDTDSWPRHYLTRSSRLTRKRNGSVAVSGVILCWHSPEMERERNKRHKWCMMGSRSTSGDGERTRPPPTMPLATTTHRYPSLRLNDAALVIHESDSAK